MANYMLVDADQLDADMTAVADAIRAKGGTTEKLEWPAGYVEAVSAGVTVRRATGTFKTNSSGVATVNCGFQPDVVIIPGFTNSSAGSYEGQIVVDFAEKSRADKKGLYSTVMDSSNQIITGYFTQASNGFSITMSAYDMTFSGGYHTNASYSYIAIKYTE